MLMMFCIAWFSFFAGDLLSVSEFVARRVQGLFNFNERAVYFGTWEHGFFAMAAVGATNVGSIKVYHDKVIPCSFFCDWFEILELACLRYTLSCFVNNLFLVIFVQEHLTVINACITLSLLCSMHHAGQSAVHVHYSGPFAPCS